MNEINLDALIYNIQSRSISELYWIFGIIMTRCYVIFSIVPILSGNSTPKFIRIYLSICIALIITPAYLPLDKTIHINFNTLPMMLLIVKEAFYGLFIGYLLTLPFYLLKSVGDIIDIQRGEQFGALINRTTNTPDSTTGRLLLQAFIVYFVISNGLLFIIETIIYSFSINSPFEMFPPMNKETMNTVIDFFSNYFYWVIVLAFPVIFTMLMVDLVLGLVSSFIPQMNTTALSMPIKSVIAIFILMIYIGNLFHIMFIKFLAAVKSYLLY